MFSSFRLFILAFATIVLCNHVSVVQDNPPINLIFLGNPGVGKSSLLNQLQNKAAFSAGINIGGGLTTETAMAPSFTYNGREVRLIDTPGLADAEMREKACEQITRGLQQGDDYKIVFVVTEIAGRVVDQDRTTIRLILESIQGVDLRNKYAIIVNQVDSDTMPKLEAQFEKFSSLLMAGFPHSTGQVLLLPEEPRLKGKDNVLLPPGDDLTQKLIDFLALVPPVPIPTEAVKAIRIEKYDETHNNMVTEGDKLFSMMEGMMASISSRLEKSEDKNAALIGHLMEAQRDSADDKNRMMLQLMENQRENAMYMDRMRSEQAERDREMQLELARERNQMTSQMLAAQREQTEMAERRSHEMEKRMLDRQERQDAEDRMWQRQQFELANARPFETTTQGK